MIEIRLVVWGEQGFTIQQDPATMNNCSECGISQEFYLPVRISSWYCANHDCNRSSHDRVHRFFGQYGITWYYDKEFRVVFLR